MKAILQRVASASVTVDTHLISSIGKGVLVFAAVGKEDTRKEVEAMAAKVIKMKMWPDESGSTWKQNVQEIGGEILCVSQFTLLASTKKGNKPDFHGVANPEEARELYDRFFDKVQELYDPKKVKNGVFQAMMEVNIQNSGPVGLDYTSHDEAVLNQLLLSHICQTPAVQRSLILLLKVTLEISTSPQKTEKNSGDKEADKQNEESMGGKDERDKAAETFQMPPELLQ